MMQVWSDSYYGANRNFKFTDLFPSLEEFKKQYAENSLPLESFFGATDSEQVSTFYYLMYASYGNSTIANADTNQFYYGLFSTLFQYGPNWWKRTEIQKKIRELTLEQLKTSSHLITNFAQNPSTAPANDSTKPLDYIDTQDVSISVRGDIQALTSQADVLKDGEAKRFLDHFRHLFLRIVEPELPLLYDPVEGW